MFHFLNNVYNLNTFFILQITNYNHFHRIIYNYRDQITHVRLLQLKDIIFIMGK